MKRNALGCFGMVHLKKHEGFANISTTSEVEDHDEVELER